LGFDPNLSLHDGYNEQVKLYGNALEPLELMMKENSISESMM